MLDLYLSKWGQRAIVLIWFVFMVTGWVHAQTLTPIKIATCIGQNIKGVCNSGQHDLGFGNDGKVSSDFGLGQSRGQAVAVQPDGKIVLVGIADSGAIYDTDFLIVRYHPSGNLDTSFGHNGQVITNFSGHSADRAEAIVIQPNGKILVAGASNDKFAVARYLPDGSLDTTFGSNGKAITDFGNSSSDAITAIALQPDNKIVAVGKTDEPSNFALARYLPDGSLDGTFGDDGKVISDFTINNYEVATAVTLQLDGKIVVAGDNSKDFVVARYLPKGDLDASFGANGWVVTDIGVNSFDSVTGLTIQLDGKLVVVGSSSNDLAVVRYLADGNLDTTFGNDGKVITDLNDNDRAVAVASVSEDAKIVVAGSSYDTNPYNSQFVLIRYNSNGNLDTTFGTTGVTTTDFDDFSSEASDLALQPSNEKIIVVGTTNNNLALARYSNSGHLDPAFDLDGRVTTVAGNGYDEVQAIALQSDDKIIVAGSRLNYGSIPGFLVRYQADGRLDTVFGNDGVIQSNFPSFYPSDMSLQPDDKIVLAGSSSNNGNSDFALTRYHPDGNLDTSFGNNGLVLTDFRGNCDEANAVALQPDGKIIAAGSSCDSNQDRDFALARYYPDGSLDTSFGNGGRVITDLYTDFESIAAIALYSDGKIAAIDGGLSGGDFAVARYLPDGRLDSSFGNGGLTVTDSGGPDFGRAVVVQTDGKLVIAGIGNSKIAILRFTGDGRLDPTFGIDGQVYSNFGASSGANALELQPDGKIIVAGNSFDGVTNYDFALARYNPDGSFDLSFGNDGKIATDFGLNYGYEFAKALLVQPDGKFLAAGVTNSDIALARYLNDSVSIYLPLVIKED